MADKKASSIVGNHDHKTKPYKLLREKMADRIRVGPSQAFEIQPLLVRDNGERSVIPASMQLIAARMAQEYNLRKERKGDRER